MPTQACPINKTYKWSEQNEENREVQKSLERRNKFYACTANTSWRRPVFESKDNETNFNIFHQDVICFRPDSASFFVLPLSAQQQTWACFISWFFIKFFSRFLAAFPPGVILYTTKTEKYAVPRKVFNIFKVSQPDETSRDIPEILSAFLDATCNFSLTLSEQLPKKPEKTATQTIHDDNKQDFLLKLTLKRTFPSL